MDGDPFDFISAIGGLIVGILGYDLSKKEYSVSQVQDKAEAGLNENEYAEQLLSEDLQNNDITTQQYQNAITEIQDALENGSNVMQQVYNNWNYDKSMNASYRQAVSDSNTEASFLNNLKHYTKISRALNYNAKAIRDWQDTYSTGINAEKGFTQKIESVDNQDKKIIGVGDKAGSDSIVGRIKNSSKIVRKELKGEENVWGGGNKSAATRFIHPYI